MGAATASTGSPHMLENCFSFRIGVGALFIGEFCMSGVDTSGWYPCMGMPGGALPGPTGEAECVVGVGQEAVGCLREADRGGGCRGCGASKLWSSATFGLGLPPVTQHCPADLLSPATASTPWGPSYHTPLSTEPTFDGRPLTSKPGPVTQTDSVSGGGGAATDTS